MSEQKRKSFSGQYKAKVALEAIWEWPWRSVKHEDVYLKGYATMPELLLGLAEYFVFCNTERTHQSLGYSTPDAVYRTAGGGGASIRDKFSEKKTRSGTKYSRNKTGAASCRCV